MNFEVILLPYTEFYCIVRYLFGMTGHPRLYSPSNIFTAYSHTVFDILLMVHLSITLANDQLDTQFLYFIIRLVQSSTCFEHYMLIIRRLNCIDASVVATGVVNLPMPPLCSAFRAIFRFPLLPTRTGTDNVRSQCSYLFSS